MFGLTALETKLAMIAGMLVLALIALGVFAWHERSVGAAKCIQDDREAAAAQQSHQATVYAQGQTTVFQEASDYHEAVSAPIVRPVHVRVCEPAHPSGVPQTAPARPVSDGTAPLPGPDHADPVPDQSIGPELQAVGRDADAQILELQDYILRVCSRR